MLSYLFHRYFQKTATQEERDELMRQLHTLSDEKIAELMDEVYQEAVPSENTFKPKNREKVLREILAEKTVDDSNEQMVVLPKQGSTGWKLPKINWSPREWVAAAVIVLAASLTLLFFTNDRKDDLAQLSRPVRYQNDVPPGGDKARLLLADGTSIALDGAGEGSLAVQGNTRIRSVNGGNIVYEADSKLNEAVETEMYNTLSTPRGGRFQLTLPDGSKVWLNAASSIRYPVKFGKERIVEISGEAYLEVAPNPHSPFKVVVADADKEEAPLEIAVLGTHFNVMAYPEEPAVKTSLLEGAVRISRGGVAGMLKPGEQARVENDAIRIVRQVNMDEVTAWKQGYFQFDNASIETIMKQVARWYNVSVHYEGEVSKKFSVLMIPRKLPVSRLLELLEFTGNVQFEIEGRRITVMP